MTIVSSAGQTFGIQNQGNLYFTIEKARYSKSILRKAAEIIYGVTRGHPFAEGNKRTAYEAARIVLLANGFDIRVDDAEGEEFMLKIAMDEDVTVQDIESWVGEHLHG